MSFMFNPHSYDDPKAVNHIPMGAEFCSSITKTTVDTAKKLVSETQLLLQEQKFCVLAIDGFISAPFEQLAGQISIQAALKGIKVTTLSTDMLWIESQKLHDKLLPYLPENRETDPVLLYG
ncbi:MAG: phosphoheptose isomerase, partial [Lacrimispora sp.]